MTEAMLVLLVALAASFSPAVTGMALATATVPTIEVLLDGDLTTLSELGQTALKAGFLDKLQAASDQTLDRRNIVVELSERSPIKADAFFMPGSGAKSDMSYSEVHAIADAIQYEGSFVTPDEDVTQYQMVFATANRGEPSRTI